MSAEDFRARMRRFERLKNLYNEKKGRFQPMASGKSPQTLEKAAL
jgi:hypothetical protein